jgi:hypothetical protein
VSLNEEQSLLNLTSALVGPILETEIPKDGQSLAVLDARNGLKSFCHRKDDLICRFCQILENVIPKDGQSLCEEKVILIPTDDLIWRLAYARLSNQNRVIQNRVSQSFYLHRKGGLTSSCALGGRPYPGHSEAYLTTLFFEFCHLMILGRDRRSSEERAERDLLLCDEASDLIRF